MAAARVLIVDDSVVVRKLLSDIIASDPELELGGTAANAIIALQKIPQINPDIILLDVEMPEMNGIEAARRIRAGWPKLPIVMCSTLTERGADATLRALEAGASDYVAKPTSVGGGSDLRQFKLDVLRKLKSLTGRDRLVCPVVPRRVAPTATPGSSRTPQKAVTPVSLLAIGCSTGGPAALQDVFKDLPGDLGVPILIVQHMPPLFTRMLAERLSATSKVKVTEAVDREELLPNRAYVAPGNYHVGLVRDGAKVRIALNQDPPENSCRPAVDVTFRAIAKLYGPGVLAAVLTGMGHDGTRGSAEIVEGAGSVIVQSAATCVVPSMPGSVATAGLADAVYPLAEIGRQLAFIIKRRARDTRTTSFSRIAP